MPSPTGMQIYDQQGHRLYLTGSERAAFRTAAEAAPREVRTYCWTLLYTGCRPSEALALTADRVDFQAAVLTFESKKKRRPGLYRAVPVPATLLDALDLVHGLRDRATRTSLWTWSLKRPTPASSRSWHAPVSRAPRQAPKGSGMALASPVSKKGFPSTSCSAGWAMPSSPRQRSMPTRWAKRSAILPPASGADTRQPYRTDSLMATRGSGGRTASLEARSDSLTARRRAPIKPLRAVMTWILPPRHPSDKPNSSDESVTRQRLRATQAALPDCIHV